MRMNKERIVSVVGLGYVGLPVAVAFGKCRKTVGFDINPTRIAELKAGHDRTGEVIADDLAAANILFTDQISELALANFHIVAVPTPVDSAKQPDLTSMLRASETVGRALKKGDIVVYESTVYPGVTEDECVPVLERVSGLTSGVDFTVGYSPERINPGDKEHTFANITKVVSGSDAATLDIVAAVYGSVVTAGIHRAPSIKAAEASKVIENTQRDLNIALMNELAIIFDRMGIDTRDVLAAAGTKWNFLKFTPGLVGGHCIGIDPYYLTHIAEKVGYIPQVILAGRRINDGMGKYVAESTVKQLIRTGKAVKGARVLVLGLTFKENCPDIRNSKVVDIVTELREYGIDVLITDPLADAVEVQHEYGLQLVDGATIGTVDAVVWAVAHEVFIETYTPAVLKRLCGADGCGVVVDVKGVLSRGAVEKEGMAYWGL